MSFWKKKDVRLFLVLIPVIKLINFFITYSNVVYNTAFFFACLLDLIQGYACWLVMRYIIVRMEKRNPQLRFSTIFFTKQVLFTYLATVATCIIVPDGSGLITGNRFAAPADGYYIHDLLIFFLWILLANFIYLLLRYYEVWKISEENLQGERKLKVEGITIKIGDKNIKIPLKDIRGFYVEDGATFVINANYTTFIVDSSLDKMEQRLPKRYFFRVNRKFILHRNSIISFKRIEDNKLLITTIGKDPLPEELPMSRLKAPAFKKWFEEDSAL
ncbi:MAG TPA: LytTR family DNA-binding domain-containing protein [Flavobacterium sp.]|jgi:hypothetical protein